MTNLTRTDLLTTTGRGGVFQGSMHLFRPDAVDQRTDRFGEVAESVPALCGRESFGPFVGLDERTGRDAWDAVDDETLDAVFGDPDGLCRACLQKARRLGVDLPAPDDSGETNDEPTDD